MYTVEKTYTADIGHRIHNQKLDSEFTENNSKILKCRRFHGHTFELKVRLVSNDLIDDMVLDYNELGFVKKFIDDVDVPEDGNIIPCDGDNEESSETTTTEDVPSATDNKNDE